MPRNKGCDVFWIQAAALERKLHNMPWAVPESQLLLGELTKLLPLQLILHALATLK